MDPETSASERPRRQRDAARTRRLLIEAAQGEFAAQGFKGARLRNIARAVDVQPALIHHYFGDKQGLYRAMVDAALAESSLESIRILDAADDVASTVRAFVAMMLRYNQKNWKLVAILRHGQMAGSPVGDVVEGLLRQRIQPVLAAITAFIEVRQARGEIRAGLVPGDLIVTALALCQHPFGDRAFLAACLPEGLADSDEQFARRAAAISDTLLRCCMPET